MRKIKFRAWDEEDEEMFSVARFDFADNTVYRHLLACDGYLGEDLKIMQYTGLKDKNGVEIYEGDIVECFNDGLSEVLFRKGSFGTLTYTSRGVDFYTFNEVYGTCEIIGNIYENPELLEREAE